MSKIYSVMYWIDKNTLKPKFSTGEWYPVQDDVHNRWRSPDYNFPIISDHVGKFIKFILKDGKLDTVPFQPNYNNAYLHSLDEYVICFFNNKDKASAYLMGLEFGGHTLLLIQQYKSQNLVAN